MTTWGYGEDESGGDRRVYADGEDVGWMHGVDAVRIVEEVDKLRAENERLLAVVEAATNFVNVADGFGMIKAARAVALDEAEQAVLALGVCGGWSVTCANAIAALKEKS